MTHSRNASPKSFHTEPSIETVTMPPVTADNSVTAPSHNRTRPDKAAWGWILYDWANSAFALLILVAIYPYFFKTYHAAGLAPEDSTLWYGLGASGASLFIALIAPLLGSIADLSGFRLRWLFGFAALGVLSTASLFFVGQGQWMIASALYVTGVIGFSGANLFYDALLVTVSGPRNRHLISSLGFSLGYLGSVLLLIFCAFGLIANHAAFGIAEKTTAVRLSFLLTAVWWAVFSLPLLLWTHEPVPADRVRPRAAIRHGIAQLIATARRIAGMRSVLLFLIGYFFYIDGVNTIIKMAAPLAADLAIPEADLQIAVIAVQIVGVPCAVAFGALAQRFGARNLLIAGATAYLGVTFYAGTMTSEPLRIAGLALSPIIVLALLIGAVQGGIQSLSRSYFAGLIPEHESAAFFGFYNVVGKSAAVLGPVLVGVVAKWTGSAQGGILALSVFFIIGLVILARLPRQ